ncbi:phenolic glucoside malonyltransferase 1-like [Magnolia sinica]|uniref:phenolic glucoside malonyltransferase 1-like n=1 Tax=Magnolia sinica TaxID=86752 RepID=UPI00265912DD|nr:phenolic glucoside malonyltransferase 1-like [Magnolia sinica]
MAPPHAVKLLELCQVSAGLDSVASASLPLTFFDTLFLKLPHIQRLIFYELQQPNNTAIHFLNTLLPKLKHSLALTLHLFYPLAGKLTYTSDLHFLALTLHLFYPLAGKLTYTSETGEPEIRYIDGDSISLTVAESDVDFHRLVENYPKDVTEFHPLIPQLDLPSLLSLQVTLFPNSSISIGYSVDHVAADGSTLAHFIKSWASICRSGDISSITSFPFYDRTVVGNLDSSKRSFFLKQDKVAQSKDASDITTPATMVRATFVLSRAHIEWLRQRVVALRSKASQEPFHFSTFVLTCAHVWACLVKVRVREGKTVQFVFPVDCRARLVQPIPATYFGNCLGTGFAEAERSELAKEDGVGPTSEAIGRAIREFEASGVLKDAAEGWAGLYRALTRLGDGVVLVGGSPKFRVYETDFGWGKPRKTEMVSIKRAGSFYIGDSRDEEGGVEVGLALPEDEMRIFATLFEQGVEAPSRYVWPTFSLVI